VKNQVDPKADILLAVGMIILSVVFYIASLDVPPPRYEPLGSAALPQALSVIAALLSVIVLVRAVPALKSYKPAEKNVSDVTPRPGLAVLVFCLTLAFIAVMDLELLSFVPAGIIYLTAVGYFMTHRDLKRLPRFFGFSVILVTSCYFIFTKIFYIDLP
jgi:putative tricarboxylic transport membrane protein